MFLRFRLLRATTLICLLLNLTPAAAHESQVMTLLHLLDYIGVDYAGAVENGAIKSAGEYTEMQEFTDNVGKGIASLPAHPDQPGLQQQAAALIAAVAQKADAAQVRASSEQLAQALVRAYPVTVAPRQAPDIARAAGLYQTQCAACHGASGLGDGVAGIGMEPAPANFQDREHAAQRSVFGLYNVITLGVNGTGMPPFGGSLSEAQRWALAFYVGQLGYTDAERERGEALWKQQAAAAKDLRTLEALTNLLPTQATQAHGEDGTALVAWLRAHPGALAQNKDDALVIASTALRASVDAYRSGDAGTALQQALTAYLEGFELAEASLTSVDAALVQQIEGQMLAYRELIKSGAGIADVEQAEAALQTLLAQAGDALESGAQSALSSFIGSFIILAREGLEVILVLAAMFAFLRRTERHDALPYVHAGWMSALLLGVATWAASTWLITISGANRELTEGLTALLAAAILLSVGLWLHNKSYSNRWQQYVSGKMKGALSGGGLWGLALLSFIATYREVFETVLFYRALWDRGDHNAILLGFAAALVVLLGLIWAVFKLSMRLPLKQFFSASSALIVVLAVIFTGHGIAALQEAGWLSVQPVAFIRVPLLGIYPNLQGLLLQAATLTLVLAGFSWNHFSARQHARASQNT